MTTAIVILMISLIEKIDLKMITNLISADCSWSMVVLSLQNVDQLGGQKSATQLVCGDAK